MPQPNKPLFPLITFIFWSWWTLINGAVSEPQTNLLSTGCSPSINQFVVTNFSVFSENVNRTFLHIRKQIVNKSKHFATAQQASVENSVFALFQCRNYISIHDCVVCFDVAAKQVRKCAAGTQGGRAVYDGCFLRCETKTFFDQTTEDFNAASCGNQTVAESSTLFTSLGQKVLRNLQTTTPKKQGFVMATKAHLPANNNGTLTIYGFAQCTQTITQRGCDDCLKACYSNMQICLPNLDGKAFAGGCFMRYSTTSFFPDNYQTIDITPMEKQGPSNKRAIIVGGVVGGVVLVLILLILFFCIVRRKCTKRVYRGDIMRAAKLKGLVRYSYKDLKFATENFSEENKLGEGGFGAVYKGTLRDGKEVAVKKLTLRNSRRMEEGFESEVMLISDAHHPNLVQLLGWCSSGLIRILVYEYMKNNSLDKFLFDDDLQPRIADFGLARLLPEDRSHLSTKFAGTLGYTAPEYAIHGQLSEKADIYSYGIVILEIISGQRSKALKDDGDTEDEFLLPKAWKLYEKGMHLELVDNTLDPNEYDADEVKKIIEIGLLCTQAFADLRPTMSEVIGLLQSSDLLENITPSMPLLIVTD
ncbi:cysteine-rich receptor-like protein kinase 3 isoform X2 [Neltuma alba]|uniref:cysteine-rich receptor-like protein kinase 3 isoform X2 n=1 Tax=Neltuma alba TaxID=207710 RepID=UPI0010A403B8|nr:cysteine-rich receptor-like protein kinase 3 isoform X2 [Prosopis alba]